MHGGGSWVYPATRWALYVAAGFTCCYCGVQVEAGAQAVRQRGVLENVCDAATLDHTYPPVRPRYAGCVVACWACNAAVGPPEPALHPRYQRLLTTAAAAVRWASLPAVALQAFKGPRLQAIVARFDVDIDVALAHLQLRQATPSTPTHFRPEGTRALHQHQQLRRPPCALSLQTSTP